MQINFWWHDIFMQSSYFSKLKFPPRGPQFVLLMTFFLPCITISIGGEKKTKTFLKFKRKKQSLSHKHQMLLHKPLNGFHPHGFETEWASTPGLRPCAEGLRDEVQPNLEGKKSVEKSLPNTTLQQHPHTTGPLPASRTPVPFHSSFGEVSTFGPWFKSRVTLTARS